MGLLFCPLLSMKFLGAIGFPSFKLQWLLDFIMNVPGDLVNPCIVMRPVYREEQSYQGI